MAKGTSGKEKGKLDTLTRGDVRAEAEALAVLEAEGSTAPAAERPVTEEARHRASTASTIREGSLTTKAETGAPAPVRT
ncbi:MAG TPA: hypothetical protein VHV30_03835 [Polyangiaceae bacterium]|jgi:hypothetical protein|nr:hypothetical protein [Polyangiaceae bacterium]